MAVLSGRQTADSRDARNQAHLGKWVMYPAAGWRLWTAAPSALRTVCLARGAISPVSRSIVASARDHANARPRFGAALANRSAPGRATARARPAQRPGDARATGGSTRPGVAQGGPNQGAFDSPDATKIIAPRPRRGGAMADATESTVTGRGMAIAIRAIEAPDGDECARMVRGLRGPT